jgi:hypothetical protein
MAVIPHRDVGVDHPPGLLRRLTQTLEKRLPIKLVAINQVAEVATAHHVINRSGIFNSQRERHGGRVSRVDTPAVNSSIIGSTLSRTN